MLHNFISDLIDTQGRGRVLFRSIEGNIFEIQLLDFCMLHLSRTLNDLTLSKNQFKISKILDIISVLQLKKTLSSAHKSLSVLY